MDLLELRNGIDEVDNQILALLNQRMELVKKVGDIKRTANTIIYRPEREKQILDRLMDNNQGLLTRQAIDAIFFEIFAVSRNLELPERISYLGPEGSFTHQAAEGRFGAMSEYLVLPTIHSVFESVETGRAKFGVVPIENNQEGIVVETVDYLRDKNLTIVAEILLPIHFSFVSQSDTLKDIKRIYSKDIAFRQCGKFISEYLPEGVEIIPVESTSKAAKIVAKEVDSAAICSSISARLFGVPMLYENIEDSDQNKTRFLILAKNVVNAKSDSDKTTIIANLANTNRPGILYDFLKDFNDKGINLTKIESRPVRGEATFRAWFLVEFMGHIQDPDVQEIMEKYGTHLKWLGSYVRVS